MFSVPVSLMPWFVGSFIMAIFGVRGFMRYRRLKSPLSLYFGISGLTIGYTFLMWSLPLIVTDNEELMRVLVASGDVSYFFMLVMQVKILAHLTTPKQFHKVALVIASIIAIIGLISTVDATLTGKIGIIDNEVFLPTAEVSQLSQMVLLLAPLLIGLILIFRSIKQGAARSKLGLIGAGALYLLTAIGGLLNVTLSSSTNSSPYVIPAYIFGFIIFGVAFIVVRLTSKAGN